jgi:signal transduction histidine kinase
VNKPLSDLAQRLTGIKQVIAVPFFIGDEVIGNLFAASREPFSERDIKFLKAFGNQAASAIQAQRYLAEMRALERVTLSLQANITDETQVLQIVVDTVAHTLGYVGAMVATLETEDRLPVRAYAVGFDNNILRHLEDRLGITFVGSRSVSVLSDPRFQENLSFKAVRGDNGRPQKFVVSDSLYDLFRPVVNKPLSDLAQRLTGIKQVMAVPFFLEEEVVGNLFVATQRPHFSDREKEILAAFGQQAAVGIRNARLYRVAEERRQIAQVFARMAFSAAASIHALRNHIGAGRTFLQMVKMSEQFPPEQRGELLKSGPDVLARMNEAAEILDSLHEPWRQNRDVPTDINTCLTLAIQKIFPHLSLKLNQAQIDTGQGVTIFLSLAASLPSIKTSPDMLTEAFRVLGKNAVEAIQQGRQTGQLRIESHLNGDGVIEIIIGDNGIGIKPENLAKVFEMGWSTKKGEGMGFGLFWAKDYIEGLGGEIEVESIWQKGTTFNICLPTVTA